MNTIWMRKPVHQGVGMRYTVCRKAMAVLLSLLMLLSCVGCGLGKTASETTWGRADAKEIDVNSKVAGRVVELLVKEGDTVEAGQRHLLVFGDRFPLLYFCREYGLDYRAAFHGCSGDTEPSLATLKYLIDKVRAEQIPVVYTIELSSRKVANAIAETTGVRVLTFHSCQTLTRQGFDGGETYLSLMWKNVDVLKEGLA